MRALTDQVLDVLRADGRFAVGDAEGPDVEPPYVVCYPLVEERDGSFADPFSDVRKFYELICAGADRWQSEWVADQAKAALEASDLVLVDMTTVRTDRDDTTGSPAEFKTWVRIEVRSTIPAPTGG